MATGHGGGTGSGAPDSGNGIYTAETINLSVEGRAECKITASGGSNYSGSNSGNGIYAGALISKDNWDYQNVISAIGGSVPSALGTNGCGIVTLPTGTVDVYVGEGEGVTNFEGKNGADAIRINGTTYLSNGDWTAWNSTASMTSSADRIGPNRVNVVVQGFPIIDDTEYTGYRVFASIRNQVWDYDEPYSAITVTGSGASAARAARIRKVDDDFIPDTGFDTAPIITHGTSGVLKMRARGNKNISPSPKNFYIDEIRFRYGGSDERALLTQAFPGVFVPTDYGTDNAPSMYTIDLTGTGIESIWIEPHQYFSPPNDWTWSDEPRSFVVRQLTTGLSYSILSDGGGLAGQPISFPLSGDGNLIQITVTDQAHGNTPRTADYLLLFKTDVDLVPPEVLSLNADYNQSTKKALLTATVDYAAPHDSLYYEWYARHPRGAWDLEPFSKGNTHTVEYDDFDQSGEYNFRVVVKETASDPRGISGSPKETFVEIAAVGIPVIQTLKGTRDTNSTASVSAQVSGVATYKAQWYRFETEAAAGGDSINTAQGTQAGAELNNNTAMTDSGLTAGKAYFYRLRVTASDGTIKDSSSYVTVPANPATIPDPGGSGALTIDSQPTIPTSMSKTGGSGTHIMQVTSGGTGPYTWAIEPPNTAGVTLNGSAITINPAQATGNNITFLLRATDTVGKDEDGKALTGFKVYTIAVNDGNGNGGGSGSLSITTGSSRDNLPTNSSSTLNFSASGGTSPYKNWTVTNATGSLNGKITMNATTGVATIASGVASGQYSFNVSVTDSTTPTALTATQTFNVGIGTAAASPSPSGSISPSPSPSASAKLTADSITISGAPANNTMYVGDKITLTPTLASGLTRSTSKWEYDTTYFTLSASGETATFTAKKAGTTQILYSVTDTTGATATKIVNVTILPRVGLPQTGQDGRWPTAMLWAGAALLMLAPFAEKIRTRMRGMRFRAQSIDSQASPPGRDV